MERAEVSRLSSTTRDKQINISLLKKCLETFEATATTIKQFQEKHSKALLVWSAMWTAAMSTAIAGFMYAAVPNDDGISWRVTGIGRPDRVYPTKAKAERAIHLSDPLLVEAMDGYWVFPETLKSMGDNPTIEQVFNSHYWVSINSIVD